MNRDANPKRQSIDTLRARYARLSDFDIAELYAQGRETFASDAAWSVLSDEYRQRQLAGSETADVIEENRVRQKTIDTVAGTQAPFATRAFQGLVDLGLAWAIGWILGFVIGLVMSPNSFSYIGYALGFLIGFFGYQPLFEARTQATPVMRFMDLEVVTTLGERPGFGRLLSRSLLRPFGLFGLLWVAIWGTWWGHDVLSGTRVVQAKGGGSSAA